MRGSEQTLLRPHPHSPNCPLASPEAASHRRSFFIIEMVDTKVLFLNVDHGLHELFLCRFRPSSDVLQENF